MHSSISIFIFLPAPYLKLFCCTIRLKKYIFSKIIFTDEEFSTDRDENELKIKLIFKNHHHHRVFSHLTELFHKDPLDLLISSLLITSAFTSILVMIRCPTGSSHQSHLFAR